MDDSLFVKAKKILKRKTSDAFQLKNRLPFAKEIKYEAFVRKTYQIVSALRMHGTCFLCSTDIGDSLGPKMRAPCYLSTVLILQNLYR